MHFAETLQQLVDRRDLATPQAEGLMDWLMEGQATDAQIGGVLTALRMKGVVPDELVGFARAMRAKATMLDHRFDRLVDTCGTGGGKPSFNMSTAAAIVAASAGAKVAKHGNRGVTSSCGSADVLEQLGVRFSDDPEVLSKVLERCGFVFLFAPTHHPAMRFVGKARRELGVRTVFNQLGPLANPAGAKRQLIGVYDRAMLRPMAEALRMLGSDRAMVVHSEDGLDEISPVAATYVAELRDGAVEMKTITPEELGLKRVESNDILPGVDVETNAEILREALYEVNSPRSLAIIPGAAAAIWLGGAASNLSEAAAKARAAIRNGLTMTKLEAIIYTTQQLVPSQP